MVRPDGAALLGPRCTPPRDTATRHGNAVAVGARVSVEGGGGGARVVDNAPMAAGIAVANIFAAIVSALGARMEGT